MQIHKLFMGRAWRRVGKASWHPAGGPQPTSAAPHQDHEALEGK